MTDQLSITGKNDIVFYAFLFNYLGVDSHVFQVQVELQTNALIIYVHPQPKVPYFPLPQKHTYLHPILL